MPLVDGGQRRTAGTMARPIGLALGDRVGVLDHGVIAVPANAKLIQDRLDWPALSHVCAPAHDRQQRRSVLPEDG